MSGSIFAGIGDVCVPRSKWPHAYNNPTPTTYERHTKDRRFRHEGSEELKRPRRILGEHMQPALERAGLGPIWLNTSRRNVPYIAFYKRVGDYNIKFGVTWFCGSSKRDFVGFKLFWTSPLGGLGCPQTKKKFRVPAPAGDQEQGDPRPRILLTATSLINFIVDIPTQEILGRD